MKSDLIQFAHFFAHGITVQEYDDGLKFATFPCGWSDDRVHVRCLSRFAREVWFRGEFMGIVELEPER